MNIFHTVTLKSLRKNKTRTIVTIIGIILSAAMICAVTTFTSSFQNYAFETAIYSEGAWHVQLCNADAKTYEAYIADDRVENSMFTQQLGYSKIDGHQNKYKPYIYLLAADENAQHMLGLHLTSGRYPQNQSEIMLPEHLYSNGGVKYRIDDSITLDLGVRLLEGEVLTQHNPAYIYGEGTEILSDESLEVNRSMTFTVVGFYERPNYSIEGYDAPGYTAFTAASVKPAAAERGDIFLIMKNPEDAIEVFENALIGADLNTDVLMFSGVFKFDSFYTALTSVAAIVTAIIMLGSISLIYNAFSISVSERTKQFGLLASVGATKRQLKKMVLFEALAVSAVGIPLGIASGIGGIGITLSIIGDKFHSILGSPINMTMSVSIKSVIVAVAVSLITVLISAWVPSKRATKISAVEAIRLNADIKNNKPVKTSKLMYKFFGLSGMLAAKHYKRSRKKYRATVLSLFMSIVLFVSASALTKYLTQSVTGAMFSENCDLVVSYPGIEFTDITPKELFDSTKDAKAVTDAAYCQRRYMDIEVEDKYLTEEGIEYSQPALNKGGESISLTNAVVVFVDDESFRTILTDEGIDEEDYFDPSSPLAVMYDRGTSFSYEEQKFITVDFLKKGECSLTALTAIEIDGYTRYGTYEDKYVRYVRYTEHGLDQEDYIDIPYDEANISITLNIGAQIDEIPFFSGYGGWMCIVYPMSCADSVVEQLNFEVSEYYFVYLSSNSAQSEADIKTALSDNGFSANHLRNIAEEEESSRNLVTIIRVFSYGFIVLISLIAAANVFNTINTNIGLRRREFAMLKSVGMTQKGFNKMMNYECLLYGSRALLFGIPVSIGVSMLIFSTFANVYSADFTLPWISIAIAVLSVFLVVFAAMMYSMSRIKKENPIDALKNENL